MEKTAISRFFEKVTAGNRRFSIGSSDIGCHVVEEGGGILIIISYYSMNIALIEKVIIYIYIVFNWFSPRETYTFPWLDALLGFSVPRKLFSCQEIFIKPPGSNDTIRKRSYTIQTRNVNGILRAVLTRSVIRPYGLQDTCHYCDLTP